MSIRVYWLDCREVDAAQVQHLMSAGRLEKLRQLIKSDDRRRSAAAELLLALALAKEKGCAPERVHWRALPGGKPVIDGGPHFSLAHSGEIAVCAVYERPVGIDVETPRSVNPAMRRKILSPAEKTRPDGALLATWVAKESYIKYTGEGLKRSMAGFSAVDGAIRDGEGRHLACVQRVAHPVEGCIVCVCTGHADDVILERMQWKGDA